MLVPVALPEEACTSLPVATDSIAPKTWFFAKGPSTMMGPDAPVSSRQVADIMAR